MAPSTVSGPEKMDSCYRDYATGVENSTVCNQSISGVIAQVKGSPASRMSTVVAPLATRLGHFSYR
jgi:hypothetical protein